MSSKSVVELVDRGDRIGLASRLRPARAAGRRLQRIVRIGVRLDQVELDLRRHHRPPALVRVELDDPPEHLARRDLDRAAVAVIGVVDDLRRRIGRPRHDGERREIGLEQDVAVGRVVLEALVVVGIVAGDRLRQDRARQRHGRPGEEFLDRHHLAAADPGLVGDDALDVLGAARRQPLARRVERRHAARLLGRSSRLVSFAPRSLRLRRESAASRARRPERRGWDEDRDWTLLMS